MSDSADGPSSMKDMTEGMDFQAVAISGRRLKHGVFNMVQTSQLSVCQKFQLTPTQPEPPFPHPSTFGR